MAATTFVERMVQLKDWYIKEYNTNTRSYEALCHLSNAYFNRRIKDSKNIDDPKTPVLERVVEAVPEVNREWLAFGDGPMLKKDLPKEVESPQEGRPYFDVDFLGGFDGVYDFNQTTPDGYISMPQFNSDGVYWCNIIGDSMYPLIRSGSKICIKEMSPNIDDILFGEIYALVIKCSDGTGLMRTVKWVVRCPDDETKIRLLPENKDPKYGSYQDIPKNDIIKYYRVMFAGIVF